MRFCFGHNKLEVYCCYMTGQSSVSGNHLDLEVNSNTSSFLRNQQERRENPKRLTFSALFLPQIMLILPKMEKYALSRF